MPYLFSRSFIEPLNGSVKLDQYHFAALAADSGTCSGCRVAARVPAGLGDDSSSSSSSSTCARLLVSSHQLNQ